MAHHMLTGCPEYGSDVWRRFIGRCSDNAFQLSLTSLFGVSTYSEEDASTTATTSPIGYLPDHTASTFPTDGTADQGISTLTNKPIAEMGWSAARSRIDSSSWPVTPTTRIMDPDLQVNTITYTVSLISTRTVYGFLDTTGLRNISSQSVILTSSCARTGPLATTSYGTIGNFSVICSWVRSSGGSELGTARGPAITAAGEAACAASGVASRLPIAF